MSQIKVELLGYMASDKIIAGAAWTSTTSNEDKELKTDDQIASLVNRLAHEKHGVPFEHCVFRFHIKLPIAIDRQLVKHRIAAHSGMSGRYRTMPLEYLEVADDVIDIIEKINDNTMPSFNENYNNALEAYYEVCEKANSYYRRFMTLAKESKALGLIDNNEYKRFREFFRGILPQHQMTETVFTINLRSLANFLKFRMKPEAQLEIQEIAEQMYKLIKDSGCCPAAIESLERNGWQI